MEVIWQWSIQQQKPLLRLKSPSLCHQLRCMMLMTRKLPPVEQINSNKICSAGINSMCTYTQTRTFGNSVIYINLLNQDKKRAAAKPRIHLSCVVSACVWTCSHSECEMPQGMLLPRSHHVSEGEITPNRHTSILSPLPGEPSGVHTECFPMSSWCKSRVGVCLPCFRCLSVCLMFKHRKMGWFMSFRVPILIIGTACLCWFILSVWKKACFPTHHHNILSS